MIKFSIDTGKWIALSKVLPFQNEMKTLSDENYQRLKTEIEETGFSFAVHVWRHEDKFYCLDGHQRTECLRRMFPDQDINVPIIEVEAKDYKEAKRKCLSAASAFGEFNIAGLTKTLSEAELAPIRADTMFHFPMVDIGQMRPLVLADDQEPAEPKSVIKGDEEFSKEIDEKNNYLVFLFDSKEEFQDACLKFGVKPVISMLSREYNEKMATRGIGRILDGSLLK